SITIGHNFRKLDNKLIIDTFPYCSKPNHKNHVNLPEFTFYTFIIKGCPYAYKSFKFELSQEYDISEMFNDSTPKFISLYLSEDSCPSCLPVFVSREGKKVYIKQHACGNKNCESENHHIECVFYTPNMNDF